VIWVCVLLYIYAVTTLGGRVKSRVSARLLNRISRLSDAMIVHQASRAESARRTRVIGSAIVVGFLLISPFAPYEMFRAVYAFLLDPLPYRMDVAIVFSLLVGVIALGPPAALVIERMRVRRSWLAAAA
jgi:hypothetical protein